MPPDVVGADVVGHAPLDYRDRQAVQPDVFPQQSAAPRHRIKVILGQNDAVNQKS